MTIYVQGLTNNRKLITWKCVGRGEASIVMNNISKAFGHKFKLLDLVYTINGTWLQRGRDYDTSQMITYESNPSYYYPRIDKKWRVLQ